MLTIKITCGCGQKYAFDVEPVNRAMPVSVACPVCGMDGTAAANEILAHTTPPPAPSAPRAMPVKSVSAAPVAAAAAPAAVGAKDALRRTLSAAGGESHDNWKWWYYIVAGILLTIIDIYQFEDTGRYKYLWGLSLPVLCIFIGVWDFQRKRQRSRTA